MDKCLSDFSIEQQAHLLAIAGRLLTLWFQSGKVDAPEGFHTLHNFAVFIAISSYESHDEVVDQLANDDSGEIPDSEGILTDDLVWDSSINGWVSKLPR